jgi:hypothetical protein
MDLNQINHMSMAELRTLAKAQGLALKNPKKADLITALAEVAKAKAKAKAQVMDEPKAPKAPKVDTKVVDYTAILEAVRSDKVVGRGTGSHIDAIDDEALLGKLKLEGIRAPRTARSWCRRKHEAKLRAEQPQVSEAAAAGVDF